MASRTPLSYLDFADQSPENNHLIEHTDQLNQWWGFLMLESLAYQPIKP